MAGDMAWIRKTYGVPAKRGARVAYLGNGTTAKGTIRSASHGRLNIQLDGDRFTIPFHPTWQLRYLDADSPQEASDG